MQEKIACVCVYCNFISSILLAEILSYRKKIAPVHIKRLQFVGKFAVVMIIAMYLSFSVTLNATAHSYYADGGGTGNTFTQNVMLSEWIGALEGDSLFVNLNLLSLLKHPSLTGCEGYFGYRLHSNQDSSRSSILAILILVAGGMIGSTWYLLNPTWIAFLFGGFLSGNPNATF